MKLSIYIHEKFYKTLDLGDQERYHYSQILKIIKDDKEAGLLNDFDIDKGLNLSIRPHNDR
jgi:hypothetical protein